SASRCGGCMSAPSACWRWKASRSIRGCEPWACTGRRRPSSPMLPTMTPGNIPPLSEWIVAQGLQGTHETKVLDVLCARLTTEGVPLLRVNICQPTLHPVIGGHLFIWRRGQGGTIEEDWARNVAAAGPEYSVSPFEYMMTTDAPSLRKRLV